MADHYPQVPTRPTPTSLSLLPKLRQHVSNSNQLFGIFTLLITGAILLFLTGLTFVITILGLILFSPLIILSSPIWIPVCTVLFIVTAAFLSMCGFGVVVVAALTWMYRSFRGFHPPGSDRVDYARNRIYDRANRVNLQSKMIDAAPDA